MYADSSISNNLIGEIIDDFIKHSEKNTKLMSSKLKSVLPLHYHETVDKSLSLKIYDNTSTEFKRLEFFKQTGHFIQPIMYKIGEISDAKRKSNTTVLTKKNVAIT